MDSAAEARGEAVLDDGLSLDCASHGPLVLVLMTCSRCQDSDLGMYSRSADFPLNRGISRRAESERDYPPRGQILSKDHDARADGCFGLCV